MAEVLDRLKTSKNDQRFPRQKPNTLYDRITKNLNKSSPQPTFATSKLPKIVKPPASYASDKNIRTKEKVDAGDNFAGTSKRMGSQKSNKNYKLEKSKPSHIPRRLQEATAKRNSINTEDIPSFEQTEEKTLAEIKNIQRVQLLINTDLCEEDERTNLFVPARPIPTLGQIYGANNVIDNDLLDDWLISIGPPVNSLEASLRNINLPTTVDAGNTNMCGADEQDISNNNRTSSRRRTGVRTQDDFNDLTNSEVEYPTRDYESAVITVNKQSPVEAKSTRSERIIPVAVEQKFKLSIEDEIKIPKENIKMLVKENQVTVDSYIEHPSELLQKTTTFGCESTRTLSSIGTDLADDLSSRYTLEHAEDVLDEHSLDDWDANGKERNFILLKTKGCLGTEVLSEYWQYQWEKEFSGVSLMPNSESSRTYRCYKCGQRIRRKRCGKKQDNDIRKRCKKCNSSKLLLSGPVKLSSRFDSIRKQISIRFCRKRWNHVWKKTAERWALWSKSPTKSNRARLAQYLQRSIVWENADVQTTIQCKEIGIEAFVKKVSEAISAVVKCGDKSTEHIGSTYENLKSVARDNRSRINLGPSMFPFLGASINSLHLERIKQRHNLHYPSAPDTRIKQQISQVDAIYDVVRSGQNIKHKDNTLSSDCLETTTSKEENFHNYIICENTETDLRFSPDSPTQSSMGTTTSGTPLDRAFGTNTEYSVDAKTIVLQTACVMTSREELKNNVNAETQLKFPTAIKITRGVTTTKEITETPLAVVSATTSDFKVEKMNASAQTSHPLSVLTYAGPKLISISSATMHTASVSTSMKNFSNKEIQTCNDKTNRDCNTSSSRRFEKKCTEAFKDVEPFSSTRFCQSRLISACMLNRSLHETGLQTAPESYGCGIFVESRSIATLTTTAGTSRSTQYQFFPDEYDSYQDECPSRTSEREVQRNARIKGGCTREILERSAREKINDQIVSLSKLISRRKASSQTHPDCRTSMVLSSDLNAEKWIRRGAAFEKEYPTFIKCNQSFTNGNEAPTKLSVENVIDETENEIKKRDLSFVITTAPTLAMSRDSLADVLPVQDLVRKSPSPVAKERILMVDEVTSDDTINKSAKDIVLQAKPEVTDAETQFVKKTDSACVSTSRCVFAGSTCCERNDCLFVYRKPRCVIHDKSNDTGVQINILSAEHSKESLPNHRSVGLVTSNVNETDNSLGWSESLKRNVLPPRVYKALYETAKLIWNEEPNDSSGETKKKLSTKTLDVAYESSLKKRALKTRSACVYTSLIDHFFMQRDCLDHSTDMQSNFIVRPARNKTTQTCSECKVKILNDNIKSAPSNGAFPYELLNAVFIEACTMKPSGRREIACQTNEKAERLDKIALQCILSPAPSLTDICKSDKQHLKAVYNILSAIEGRIRRMRANL
ncbi:uncharacterized protein LOC101735909 isoform X2 [Bombyx mori]|uniref:Uncharacterized protein n=1 Tax=Bombyx mori TaxID=7091 RepID=A0A8R2R6S7_BOMMO|nr:uncharacterized protein LOC101735909 isoform X2 [Bombyx mori]